LRAALLGARQPMTLPAAVAGFHQGCQDPRLLQALPSQVHPPSP
jgi:hypothetical protein